MKITESQLRRIVREEAGRLVEGRGTLPQDFDAYIMQALKGYLVDGNVGFEDAISAVEGRIDRVMDEFESWCWENDVPQVSVRPAPRMEGRALSEAAPGGVVAYVYLGGPSVRMGARPVAFGRLLQMVMPDGVTIRRHTTSEIHEQARINAPSTALLEAAITALIMDGRIAGAQPGDERRLAAKGIAKAAELGWRAARM